jgi:hypothetical protein
MSENSPSAAPKARPADSTSATPITDALYGKKNRRPGPARPVRESTGQRTFSLGSQLRQKLGGRGYGALLDALARRSK